MVTESMDNVADVVFLIEGTAINGAYINDIKTNYIVPTVELFSQTILEEHFCSSERNSTLYGIVVFKTAQAAPSVSCTTYGPFSSGHKVLNTIDKLE